MKFSEIVEQAGVLLQRKGRVTYRALKREFDLDDELLTDVKDELIKAAQVARDENGEVLVWVGDEGTGEAENQRSGEPKASPQPLTPSTQPPAPTRLPISPNASGEQAAMEARSGPTVNVKRSRRCLPISKARRR